MEISTDPSSASSSTAVSCGRKKAPRKVTSDKYRAKLTPAKKTTINEKKKTYMKQKRASRKLANTDFAECSPSLTTVNDVLDADDDNADVVNDALDLDDADDDADVVNDANAGETSRERGTSLKKYFGLPNFSFIFCEAKNDT